MINTDEQFIRHLVQSPNWRIIDDLAKEITDRINNNSVLRDTNEETLKETLLREGRIQGIKQLLSEMYFIGTK